MGAARLRFDELPPEIIDRFMELRKAFLAYFLQQKKYIKDLVEIHHIKQKEGESTEAFMDRFKVESLHAPLPMSSSTENQNKNKFLTRQKTTYSFSLYLNISFSPLENNDEEDHHMVIQAEIGGHLIHHQEQDDPATTLLLGFSEEISLPLGQISLLASRGDKEHSTSTWKNLMIVGSLFQYNGTIGRLGIRKIQIVPSATHGMLKFPVLEGVVTLYSSRATPVEC
ncbi:hypothetical protein Tco_0277966 [Tanacetum coccineum]